MQETLISLLLTASEAGAGSGAYECPSLSVEELLMTVHQASSRKIEVLNRTTGNVDQVLHNINSASSHLTAQDVRFKGRSQ